MLTSSIHSFNIFDIKSSSNYDTYFEALALERTNNIKNIVTNKVIKNNINAVENYTLDTNNLEQFIKINIINPDKTSLVRVDFFNKDKVLIESINEKKLLNVPIELVQPKVRLAWNMARSNWSGVKLVCEDIKVLGA